jgi:hypothetical protein
LIEAGFDEAVVEKGKNGLVLLGGAIGNFAYRQAHVELFLNEGLQRMTSALSMPRYQERHRLVFGSVGLKPSFLARIMALGEFEELIAKWDGGLRNVLQSVVPGGTVTDQAWAIACLPTSLGGLGVPALHDCADAAFVSSRLSAAARSASVYPRSEGLFLFEAGSELDGSLEAALARLVERAPIIASFVDLNVPNFDRRLQTRIVHELHQAALLRIRSGLSPRENARLLSQSGESGCWSTITPTHPDLVISNSNFSTSIGERICIPFHATFGVSAERTLLCPCGTVFDSFHALNCRADGNPERTIIHDVVKLGVAAMMAGAGVRSVRIEPSASDTNNKRADLEAVINGSKVWLDVVTVSTARACDGSLAAHIPGAAGLAAERAKSAAYVPLVAAHGSAVAFIPLAYELDGRWGDMAMDFFRVLSRLRGDCASEHAAWLASWHKLLASRIRNAVASALDSRLKKAVAAAPPNSNSYNPLGDAYIHILSSPPMGSANPTFEREGDLQQSDA